DELSRHLPVINLDKAALGPESRYCPAWFGHPPPAKNWPDAWFLEKLQKSNIPAFPQPDWFDAAAIGTNLTFSKMPPSDARTRSPLSAPGGTPIPLHKSPSVTITVRPRPSTSNATTFDGSIDGSKAWTTASIANQPFRCSSWALTNGSMDRLIRCLRPAS